MPLTIPISSSQRGPHTDVSAEGAGRKRHLRSQGQAQLQPPRDLSLWHGLSLLLLRQSQDCTSGSSLPIMGPPTPNDGSPADRSQHTRL